LLTGLRALLAPVVMLLSLFAPLPQAFAVCLVAAFLSDIFDGAIYALIAIGVFVGLFIVFANLGRVIGGRFRSGFHIRPSTGTCSS
jgi:hypothetical protein